MGPGMHLKARLILIALSNRKRLDELYSFVGTKHIFVLSHYLNVLEHLVSKALHGTSLS